MLHICTPIRVILVALFAYLSLTPLSADATIRKVPENRQQVMLSYAPLIKKTAPAVVNIYTRQKVRVPALSNFFANPFFDHFFGRGFQNRMQDRTSTGSGVIIRSSGLVITNSHVLQNSNDVVVILNDGREFPGKILLKDEKTDLALLAIEVENEKLPYLELHDSDMIEVGDIVLAIGNPFGIGQTVTSGIISALSRTTVSNSDYQSFIQTDAAINPGNSGGALVDMNGKLIGINTAIFSKSGGSNGVGFSIPSNMVSALINSVEHGYVSRGRVLRPWLGASLQPVTKEIASVMSLKTPKGVLINMVYKNAPAQKAGLQEGDIIIAIDGKQIKDEQALGFRMATHAIGSKVPFTIIRNGKTRNHHVTMEVPVESPPRDLQQLSGNHPLSGIEIGNMSPALAYEFDIPFNHQTGVVVTAVDPRDIAYRLGVRTSDIIVELNHSTIRNTRQLANIIGQQSGWRIKVLRGNKFHHIVINP